MDLEYNWCDVEGIRCIKTHFKWTKVGRIPNKESNRRRDIKNKLGAQYPDTIIIDSNSQGKICNALVYAKSTDKWLGAFNVFYGQHGYYHEEFQLTNAKQHQWKCADYIVLFNVYSNNKIMVQGGETTSERDILHWIKDFFQIKEKILESEDACVDSDCLHQIRPNSYTNIAERSARPDLYVSHVTLPPVSSIPDCSNIAVDPNVNDNRESRKQNEAEPVKPHIVIDELLCFVQNRSQTMARDLLVQLCCQFYSTEVIAISKQLLLDSVHPKSRYTTKRGDKRDKENLNDIVKIFLEMDPSENVKLSFVAADLSKLPPLSVNNYDVLSVLQDIDYIKSTMNLMIDNHKNLASLFTEIATTKSNVQPCVSVQTDVLPSCASQDRMCSSDVIPCVADTVTDLENNSSLYETISETSMSDISVVENVSIQSWPGLGSPQIPKDNPRSNLYSDWRTQNTSKGKRKRNHRDVTKDINIPVQLKAAGFSNRKHSNRTQIETTGIFITRLQPYTSVNDVKTYIFQKTGFSLKVEKLSSKYPDSYSSFYVKADDKLRKRLLNGKIWPKEILVKSFQCKASS